MSAYGLYQSLDTEESSSPSSAPCVVSIYCFYTHTNTHQSDHNHHLTRPRLGVNSLCRTFGWALFSAPHWSKSQRRAAKKVKRALSQYTKLLSICQTDSKPNNAPFLKNLWPHLRPVVQSLCWCPFIFSSLVCPPHITPIESAVHLLQCCSSQRSGE